MLFRSIHNIKIIIINTHMSQRKRGPGKGKSKRSKTQHDEDEVSNLSEAIEERMSYDEDSAPEEPEPEGEDLQEKMEE